MTTATRIRTATATAPKFIAIQDGEYLVSLAHIVAIEMTNGLDEITLSMADGQSYTVEDHGEIDKIMNALNVL